MPSVSEKQKRFMKIACKDAEFAKKHGIDQKTACEFVEADKKAEQQAKKKKKPAYAKW